jgi:hypothetical protein
LVTPHAETPLSAASLGALRVWLGEPASRFLLADSRLIEQIEWSFGLFNTWRRVNPIVLCGLFARFPRRSLAADRSAAAGGKTKVSLP